MNDSAQKQQLQQQKQSSSLISSSSFGKEQVPVRIEAVKSENATSSELELPKEVKEAGVEKIDGRIELPPDLKKLGVTPSGQGAFPFDPLSQIPPVTLPIDDGQVWSGLHKDVKEAILWLAVWCFKKLKKAHVGLKVIHGKLTRVKI